ncbi:M24 family metallopeptidase [Candidatus Bathyarchaeota archaeon]|nr:M24 family metallopeptidase [Candidatus Bathyarchaeota archaeon]
MTSFDFHRRIETVKESMNRNDIDAILLLNTRNIYWLSGAAQASQLVLPRDGDPILMVKRNIELALKHSWFEESWIQPLGSTSEAISMVKSTMDGKDGTIGMELAGLPTTYFFKFKKGLGPDIEISNISKILRECRMVKDYKELERCRVAARVAEKTQGVVYEMLMENFKTGITEKDVAAEMIRVAKKNRAEHYCIYSNNMYTNFNNFFILTSGEALWTPSTFPIMSGTGFSPAIPFGVSDRELQEGDMVVCDYGLIVDGYHADHARSFVVNGKMPKHYEERYRNLKMAYDRTMDDVEEGMVANDIFETMVKELQRLRDPVHGTRVERYFQGNGEYYQALGHGIGLELDEPPFISRNNQTVLKRNMVLSIEPKIIIPGWGAINFEDDFIVKESSPPERMTNSRFIDF